MKFILQTLIVGLLLAAVAPLTGVAQTKPTAARQARIPFALVVAIDDPVIAAGEMGVLIAIHKKEGEAVKEGETLGQIYDLDAQAKLAVAENEEEAARIQAESKAQIEVAEAAVGVTLRDFQATEEVFKKGSGGVSKLEVDKKRFEHERAKAQVKVAETENSAAQATQKVKQAQVQVAQNEIDRRKIKSTVSGVVLRVHKKKGEWARPEEPVMQVMRLDRVRVEGFADAKVVSPADLFGKTVNVEIRLSGSDNKTVVVQGKIGFVSPQVEGTKEYSRFRIYADVDNKQVEGQWLIQPGSPASMTVDLGSAATPEAAPKPTRPTAASAATTGTK